MNSKKIDISLVITNYNKARLIDRAIRSCLNQLVFRKTIEIIVIDDASTDDSIKVISEFSDEIKLHVNSSNMGVAHSSNVGIEMAMGRYLMRVDADDYLSALSCEFLSQILDNNSSIDYVYADHYRINVSGHITEKVSLSTKDILYMHGAGVLMRTEMLRSVGGYDVSLRNCEDYDLLYRLDKDGYKGYHVPAPLYRYYIHGGNMTLTEERIMFKNIVEKKHGI